MLVCRVSVYDDILDDSAEFCVTTRLKPVAYTPVIQISYCQFFVLNKQRNQFMDIICDKVTVWVYEEGLVFQER